MALPTVVYLLVVLAPVSLLITLLAHAAVFVALSPRLPGDGPAPPITVLKPVKGDEPGLYENLASLARQDYPAYEILIGADDARDPALETARQVQEDFPQVPIGIHVGARPLGLNPKVNLLSALFDRARNDAVLISDSNVRVGPEYLREMAAEMADPAVGLVTNMVVGEGAGVGALLETLHLNSFVAAATSLARVAVGRACVIGKSMLLRRSDLERLGGLHQVRNVLAEDFVIGRMYELAGFRVALSPYLVRCMNDGWTVERFLNRHLRWAQMRRRIAPAAYLGELRPGDGGHLAGGLVQAAGELARQRAAHRAGQPAHGTGARSHGSGARSGLTRRPGHGPRGIRLTSDSSRCSPVLAALWRPLRGDVLSRNSRRRRALSIFRR